MRRSSRTGIRTLLFVTAMHAIVIASTATVTARPDGDDAHARVPCRAVTRGPAHHWFSYYDVLQWEPSGRYLLAMEVDFEHRSPRADDVIRLGMIDLRDQDRWTTLGTSRAWGWQQGCRFQWRPGSDREVLWNDRDGDHFVCRILDVFTGRLRTLPRPVYHVSPDGRYALSTDFSRIDHMRPGYGYAGLPDPNRDVDAPEDSGIYRLDLDTGEVKELFSLADIARIPYPGTKKDDVHYFNHILWNPEGSRFLFLHRWRTIPRGADGKRGRASGFRTRMFTADREGRNLRLVTDRPRISHYTWRDAEHILIHRAAFRLYRDDGSGRETTVLETSDGHQTYLPGNEWLLADTYPKGEAREQEVYLFHIPTGRRVTLGRFPLPPAYRGEWRVDTHPRIDPTGRWVSIDSAHGGEGRQVYLLDLKPVLERGDAVNALPEATVPSAEDLTAAGARVETVRLGGDAGRFRAWGRGRSESRRFFDERLPALFERTLILDRIEKHPTIRWIFTGPRGGVTITLGENEAEMIIRRYDSPGLGREPGVRPDRHPEKILG